MKYVKTFESFLNENFLFETVYQLDMGGRGNYGSIDNSVKNKVIAILKSGKWMKTEAGKTAVNDAKENAEHWNSKDPSSRPAWAQKEWKFSKDGKVEESTFLKPTALIVAVLDEMTKREIATWINAGGSRNQCFGNAAKWAEENGGNAIGGICMKKDSIGKYYAESLVVHAFGEKEGKYYEMTFPTEGLTKDIIYWPLISLSKTNEKTLSQDIWSYALGIEEGVKEYIDKHYEVG
jgi:hypothetical protein